MYFTNNRLIKTFFKDPNLKQGFEEGKLVFFVGAGISRAWPSCVPTAREFSNSILQTITEIVKTKNGNSLGDLFFRSNYDVPLFLEEVDKCKSCLESIQGLTVTVPKKQYFVRLEYLLQYYVKHFSEAFFDAFEFVDNSEPNIYHFFLTEALQKHNHVITTNYDSLIELVGKQDYTIISSETFDLYKLFDSTGILFKIHGSLKNDKGQPFYDSVGATLDSIGVGLSESRTRLLSKIFECGKTIIVIGYSFSDYFDINKYLTDRPQPIETPIIYLKHSKGISRLDLIPPDFLPLSVRKSFVNLKCYQVNCESLIKAWLKELSASNIPDTKDSNISKAGIIKEFIRNQAELDDLYQLKATNMVIDLLNEMGLAKYVTENFRLIFPSDKFLFRKFELGLQYNVLVADAYRFLGYYTKSLLYFRKIAKSIKKRNQGISSIFELNDKLGMINRFLLNFGESLGFYEQNLALLENEKIQLEKVTRRKAGCLKSIGEVYRTKFEIHSSLLIKPKRIIDLKDKAIGYLQSAQRFFNRINDFYGLEDTRRNLAKLSVHSNSLRPIELQYYIESESLIRLINNIRDQVDFNPELSDGTKEHLLSAGEKICIILKDYIGELKILVRRLSFEKGMAKIFMFFSTAIKILTRVRMVGFNNVFYLIWQSIVSLKKRGS